MNIRLLIFIILAEGGGTDKDEIGQEMTAPDLCISMPAPCTSSIATELSELKITITFDENKNQK